MQQARWKAADSAPDTESPPTTRVIAVASGKGGVGKSCVTVNLAAALAQRGFTVGVLDADIWGFCVPRMLGVTGRLAASDDDGKIRPRTSVPSGAGLLKVVSMGLLVDDEEHGAHVARPHADQGARAVPRKMSRGATIDYLLIDMPPGTGDIQMGAGRLLPRTEMIIVTTPAMAAQKVAIRGGRHGAPLVPEGARA